MFRRTPKGEEDSPIFGTHPGDFGVIVVAAMITISMVLMLILPSPFARLEKAQAEQEKIEQQKAIAERQKAIDKAVATGEVSVSISPGKKH